MIGQGRSLVQAKASADHLLPDIALSGRLAWGKLRGMITRFLTAQVLRACGLFSILCVVYFCTYTGQILTTDELLLMDGAHSVVTTHTLDLAYSMNYRPISTLRADQVAVVLDSEPLQAYLSAPLMWIAMHVPGIGLMQTAMLINILITALTAVIIYFYGLTLGYTDTTALVTALIFGLATIAWPYSRFYFREPLAALLMLLSLYGIERWRSKLNQGRFRIADLALGLVALGLSLVAKQAAVLLILPLVVVGLPRFRVSRRTILIGLGIVLLIGIILGIGFQVSNRGLLNRLNGIDFQYLGQAIPGYLISPGNSLWVFSPVLLLSLVGGYRLLRTNRFRYPVALAAMVATFGIGYAVLQGANWIGGKAWGPRYMVPLTPFLCLLLLPVIESILARRWKLWANAIAIGLIVQSVLVQIVAAIVPLEAYPNYLFSESKALNRLLDPIAVWREGTWNPLYNAILVSAHQINAPTPIAWIVNNSGGVVLPLAAIAGAIGLWSLWRPGRIQTLVGLLVLPILFYGGLHSFYRDIRYDGNNEDAWKVLDSVTNNIHPGDVVLLNDDETYRNFFINYFKAPEPIYTLPNAPGERFLPDQPPALETDLPDERVSPFLPMMLARLSARSTRWWFITQYTPFSQGRLRPNESYLARHYYPMGENVSADRARLLLYAPLHAPSDTLPPWPETPRHADFGAATLIGFDLPRTTFRAGESIPVSLVWLKTAWPSGLDPLDYGVNVALLSADGRNMAQHAGTPIGSFGGMTAWITGGYYRDNHALDNIPPGNYDLWLSLYDWRDGHKLPVTENGSPDKADHVVLAHIQVR
jgi:hypothetical protein